MEYYPVKDTAEDKYWKIVVMDEVLHLEENSQPEQMDYPIVADENGVDVWEVQVEHGMFKLVPSSEPPVEVQLEDSQTGIKYKLIVSYGVIGIIPVGIMPLFVCLELFAVITNELNYNTKVG